MSKPELKTDDWGTDLEAGQVVWIRGCIAQKADLNGDVKVRFQARPGHIEHACPTINAIFLRRPTGWRAWLIRVLLS